MDLSETILLFTKKNILLEFEKLNVGIPNKPRIRNFSLFSEIFIELSKQCSPKTLVDLKSNFSSQFFSLIAGD